MNLQSSTARASGVLPLQSPDALGPFQRLVPLQWAPSLLLICAGMLASFLIAGFWYPYWRIADMDFMVVYNALLLNAHLPQELFDHPFYLSFLLLSEWLRALHAIGLMPVDSFATLPSVDLPGFAKAWTEATQAGRVLSLIFAMVFVVAFSFLLRALVRHWRIAILGGFLLAFSGGMAMQMREMRTELPSAALFAVALLVAMVAGVRGSRPWRPVAFGVAALLITLGMQFKIQIFFLMCPLPVLLLPVGPDRPADRGFWDEPQRAWLAVAVSAAVAAVAVYLARHLLAYGFMHNGAAELRLPVLRLGAPIYWPMMAAWIGLGMAAYAIIWRVTLAETLAAMFTAVAGCMIGLLALYVRYHPNNLIVVLHPMEEMFFWAAASNRALRSTTSLLDTGHLEFLFGAVWHVILQRTFVFSSSTRGTIFVEWFVIVATVIAMRRREWRLVFQVAALMLTVWAVDTLAMGRGLKQQYFILTDPLAIIAAALLIAKLADLQYHRAAYRAGVVLIAVNVVLSQAEPVKHLFRKQGPEVLCDGGLSIYYPRLGRLPFCPP